MEYARIGLKANQIQPTNLDRLTSWALSPAKQSSLLVAVIVMAAVAVWM